jgi:TetR/AcrR family transcriptional repressor of nem operon
MPTRRRSRPKSVPRPRAETMQATRAALIAAAMEEFATHGLDASLDRICARAELTRGAFYVHFADREALIEAVMADVLGRFVGLLVGMEPTEGGTRRAIELFTAAAAARSPAVHGGRALRFFHLMDACHRSESLGERYRTLMMGARDQLAAGLALDQRAGKVRAKPQAPALAELMLVFALGTVAALELELPIDVPRLGQALRTVIE